MSFTTPDRIFYADDANPRLYAMQMQKQAISVETGFNPQNVAITSYIGWPGYTGVFGLAGISAGSLGFPTITSSVSYGAAGTFSTTTLPSLLNAPQVNVDGWYLIKGAFEFTYTGGITAGSLTYAQFTTSPALFTPDPTVAYGAQESAPVANANGPGAVVVQQSVALSAGDIISFSFSHTNIASLVNITGTCSIHRLGDRFTS